MTAPVASFTVDGVPAGTDLKFGAAGVGVSFVDTSSNTPTSWLWTFADGTTSTDQNPTHIYAHVGNTYRTFAVSLVATNVDGSGTYALFGGYTLGIMDFSYTVNPTGPGESIIFNGPYLGSTETYNWDFGDGNTSTLRTPTHNYAALGTYTVTLVYTTNRTPVQGPFTMTQTDVVVTTPKVSTASFGWGLVWYSGVPDFAALISATITNNGNTRTSILWDFGDGTTYASLSPPRHTFPDGTSRNVTLTVTYSNPGVPPTVVTHSITPRAFRIEFSWEITGLHVGFTNETNIGYGIIGDSGGDYLDHYTWNFGDSTTLVQTIAESLAGGAVGHDYSTCGAKTVSLTVHWTTYA